MNIDVKTGLPELPDGYYWEIREYKYESYDIIYNYTLDTLQISICTRRKRWFGTKVTRVVSSLMLERGTTRHSVVAPTTKNILKYAKEAWDVFERARTLRSAVGEYPPKKLEG